MPTKVKVGARTLSVSNLDKVLYPETGTTKADVMRYYLGVADALVPQVRARPVTRKRWPEGVGGPSFFRKDLEDSAPEWIETGEIRHKTSTNAYPLIDGPETLAWLSQVAALELHTPQWRFGPDDEARNPDRLVLDLDPGEGVEMAQIAEVALWCREILDGMGLTSVPVTSGSKGIHLYAGLDGSAEAAQVSAVAKALAVALQEEHPERVTATMRKSDRAGKVFLDWSQNNGSKTTVSPYSLRGRARPTVAAPRTWEEIADPRLRHLELDEVLERVADGIDPIAELGLGAQGQVPASGHDRLTTYRSMRDASKTGEPVPQDPPMPRDGEPIFVIGEHDATRLHWDFRLEHEGVLVSWAVPKGPPLEPDLNRLAVQTEDHPIEYATFEGIIPKGQYGAGTVKIWDIGTCVIEKWRADEIIAVLTGRPDGGLGGVSRRFALIRTERGGGEGGKGDSWLLKFMKRQPAAEEPSAVDEPSTIDEPSTPAGAAWEPPAPMLATAASKADIRLAQQDGAHFAFEMKWDGYRIIADVDEAGRVRLLSRGGKDYTALFPHTEEIAVLLASGGTLDGELVALDANGTPNFSLLRHADKGEGTADGGAELRYMAFDLLRLGKRDLTGEPYEERRKQLEALAPVDGGGEGAGISAAHVSIPPSFRGSFASAWRAAEQMGLEGVVAKQLDAPYAAGARSAAWLKVKRELHQAAVVIGVREGKRGIASLLLAVPDGDGELRYAGRVGTGFSNAQLAEVGAKLKRVRRKTAPVEVPASDAEDAWWVTPKYVAEVALAGATAGRKVRQASWRGWREDLAPDDVRWEV